MGKGPVVRACETIDLELRTPIDRRTQQRSCPSRFSKNLDLDLVLLTNEKKKIGRKPLTWANNFSRGNKKAGRKLLTWGNSLGWGNGVGGAQWCGPMMQWINRSCVPGGGLVQPAGGYPHPYPRNNGNGNGSGGTACTTSTARAANGATSTSTSCAGQGSATSSSSGKSGKKR